MLNFRYATAKTHAIARSRVFDVFSVNDHGGILAVENPCPISIKFCTVVGIHDIITYANFGDDRLKSLWWRGMC